MRAVTYETEEAVFIFSEESLFKLLRVETPEYDVAERMTILNIIESSRKKSVVIPSDNYYFGLIVLDLIDKGEGAVICKSGQRKYAARDLRPTTLGWGKSPWELKTKWKGGRRQPGKLGGRGFRCPLGHEVISRITWIT
jgi:hypothetical protein